MAKKKPVVVNDWEEEIEVSASGSNNVSVTPATHTQMAPIVQPIAFVPYTTQDQAIWQVTPSGYDIPQARRDIANAYASEDETFDYEAQAETKENKVRFVPIFLAVLSLLIVAVMVVGKFVLQTELALIGGLSGYDYVMEIVNIVTESAFGDISALIIPASVVVIALASVINLVASLIRMKHQGASVVSKICIFFMLTFSLVLVLIALMDTLDIGYGMYAVAGLSFISLLVGYLAKK